MSEDTSTLPIGDPEAPPLTEGDDPSAREAAFNALLARLRCPKTLEPLQQLTAAELDKLNLKIESSTIQNLMGEPISHTLCSAVTNSSRTFIYEVTVNAVSLIADEAIPWSDR